MSVVSQEGLKDATNEPSSHAGKRKPGFEDNENSTRRTEKAKEDGHQSDETDGTFIEKVKSVFYQVC